MDNDEKIETNIERHNVLAPIYESRHGEIFNSLEQADLLAQLEDAAEEIRTDTEVKRALDYGCGSGNLTHHLMSLGFHVYSADVSEKFLEIIRDRYVDSNLNTTIMVNGEDLENMPDNSFDLVATYSVLHHVPDYLRIVREFARVTKPGGIVYIDHEVNDNYWQPGDVLQEFLAKAGKKKKSFWRFFNPRNYFKKIRLIYNPRFQEEGDIHVFPDDHIEWAEIERTLVENGCDIVIKNDYLLYKPEYDLKVYDEYKDRCDDMRVLVARKN